MVRKMSSDNELSDQVLVLVGAGDVVEVGIPCSPGYCPRPPHPSSPALPPLTQAPLALGGGGMIT
jgi:hypothetical protein